MTNWFSDFIRTGAIWLHDGNPERPHALLASGLHSDGFVNCSKITQDPALLRRILTTHDGLKSKLPSGQVDWVIGSAQGAVTFAYALAEVIGARAAFTEKDGELMSLARFEVTAGQRVLVVEDVLSTGGSTVKTIAGIEAATAQHAEILPLIVCMVNRSGNATLNGYEIRALLTPEIKTWKPAECPLCQLGSGAVRPKTHWRELTAVLGTAFRRA